MLASAVARPEPPRGPPLRQQLPRQSYGPPSDSYGKSCKQSRYHEINACSLSGPPPSQYGPPATSYGAPPATVTKNVYVHLPPEDQDEYPAPQVIEPIPPQKHYKLIFIKAPEPPKPVAPIIPAQPQDEHKTLGEIEIVK